MGRKGLKILEIEKKSLAEKIGLAVGDCLLSANGHEIPDELALKFYLSEEHVNLRIRKADGTEQRLRADLSNRESLGIRVEDFQTQICNNACLFCFVDQLPPGVRPSLTIKDDDYRLSFLHGNYITLTNLGDKALDRIIEHHLSPLYVSVHATDPDLRRRMLGRTKTDDLDRKLRKLTGGGIRIHAQIVLMPGINDGASLGKTVLDLYRYHPGILSVAVVPLGLSDHGKNRHRYSPVTPQFSRRLIRDLQPWQEQFRSQTGTAFVYLADEFYIQAGINLPASSHYDDFAQIEDGVGMVRSFLDEFQVEWNRHRRPLRGLKGTLATGTLFYPFLHECIARLNAKFQSSLQVCAIENRFLGRKITVAGLLAGRDFLKSLRRKDLGSFLLIPQDALSRGDGILIDDMTLEDLSRSLGMPVFAGGWTAREFFKLLGKISRQ